jgi:magnesium chelatase family protein
MVLQIWKEGSAYDLTLTIGILVASEQIKAIDIDKYIIMRVVSGSLQPIRGALPIAIKAKEEGFKGFFSKAKCERSCHSYWSRCIWR